jgi:hypothetical protein
VTAFKAGDRCLVVEHVDSTRERKRGGQVFLAVVDALAGLYVIVRYDDPGVFGGKLDQFWESSGWRAWDGWFRWRLMPALADETAAVTAEKRD